MSKSSALISILSLVLVVGCGDCSDPPGKNNNNGTNGESNNTTGTNGGTNTGTNGGTNTGTNGETNTGTNGGTNGGTNTGTNGETNARPLDLLMVLDNSGSMCEVQAAFRSNLRALLAEATDDTIDVRIGVTTTHMDPDYRLEPLAEPAQLQSTPQPIPGFDRACLDEGDGFTNVREALAAALECAEGIDPSDYEWSDDEFACALRASPPGCSIDGVCGPNDCAPEDLFPDPSTYRDLPRVMEVKSYESEDGKLDFDQLVADFACMSQVGTRGHGIEKGLEAAARAVSPNLTGGSVEDPVDASAPNHGLIRRDADFSLLFVTDENDCSHDGSLDETTSCGGDVCEFANIPEAESPLVAPAEFADRLVMSLRQTKDDPEFPRSRIAVASVHGRWDRFMGPAPSDAECGMPDYEGIEPACTEADDARRAYSGDRYERFLDAFDEGKTYPSPMSDGEHRTGAICEDDLESVFLEAMTTLAQ